MYGLWILSLLLELSAIQAKMLREQEHDDAFSSVLMNIAILERALFFIAIGDLACKEKLLQSDPPAMRHHTLHHIDQASQTTGSTKSSRRP